MKEKQNWSEKLSHIITMAGTAILMNLMFLIACIPIVTIGPAWCGLMSAVRYNIRGDGWFAGFKAGYRTRFWRSLICWCLCLPVCLFFLNDLNTAVLLLDKNGMTVGGVVGLVISGLFFAMAGMLTVSLLTLNVYIPTSVSNWLKNSVNFFRRPMELLCAAALFWAPLLAFRFYLVLFLQIIMIFVAAYFALAAVCGTLVLKDPLIDFLVEARADGTLTAEEGAAPVEPEDDEEDEE